MSIIFKNKWIIMFSMLLSLASMHAEDLSKSTNTFPLSSAEIEKAENFLDLTSGVTKSKNLSSARKLESAIVFLFFFLFIWLGPLLLMRGEKQQLLKSFITALSYCLVVWLMSRTAWILVGYWSSKTDVRFSLYNPLFTLLNLVAIIAFFTLIEAFVAYLFVPKSSKIRIFGYLLSANLAAHIALLIVATIISGQF